MGWWRGPVNVEFIKMRGPGGKGHAEMAITQQRAGEERNSAEEMENDWQCITLDDSLDIFSQVEQHFLLTFLKLNQREALSKMKL